MTELLFLLPISLGLGLVGLAAFLWTQRNGQYEDLQGAAERILLDRTDAPALGHKEGDNSRSPQDLG